MNHLKIAAFSLGVSLVMIAAFVIRLKTRQQPMWMAIVFAILCAILAGWHFGKYEQ